MKDVDTKQNACVRLPATSLKLDFFTSSRSAAASATCWQLTNSDTRVEHVTPRPRVQPPC